MVGERTRQGPASASLPARLHALESRVDRNEKRLRSLSDGDSSAGDADLVGKRIRLNIADQDPDEAEITGEVLGVTKYTIRIKLLPSETIRVYRKGYIRWHEVL